MNSVPKPVTRSAPYIWTHQDLSTKLMAAVGDGYYFVHLGQRILQTRRCDNTASTLVALHLAEKCINVGDCNKQPVYAFLSMQTSQIELYLMKATLPVRIKWEDLQDQVDIHDIRYLILHKLSGLRDKIKPESMDKSTSHSENQEKLQLYERRWFRALLCYFFLAGKIVKVLVDYPGFFEDLKNACKLLLKALNPTVSQMTSYGPRLVRKAIVSGEYFKVITGDEHTHRHNFHSKSEIISATITPPPKDDGKKRKLGETTASNTESQKRPQDKRTKQELLSELEERDFDLKYYIPRVAHLKSQISHQHSKGEREKSEHKKELTLSLAELSRQKALVQESNAIAKSKDDKIQDLRITIATQLEQLAAASELHLQQKSDIFHARQELHDASAVLEKERAETAQLRMDLDRKREEAKKLRKAKAASRAHRLAELRFT